MLGPQSVASPRWSVSSDSLPRSLRPQATDLFGVLGGFFRPAPHHFPCRRARWGRALRGLHLRLLSPAHRPPSHRKDRSPRLAGNRSSCPVGEDAGTTGSGFRFETQSAIHKKVKLLGDPGEARRALVTLKVCPKSLFVAVHPRWGQPGRSLPGFLDVTGSKIQAGKKLTPI